jgi:hypothetical protein
MEVFAYEVRDSEGELMGVFTTHDPLVHLLLRWRLEEHHWYLTEVESRG